MSASVSIVTSLPGLFMACIQCFEIIQYGRMLDTDRDILILRLHYIGVILLRWGAWKGIIGPNTNAEAADPQIEECRPLLQAIKARFDDAQRKSEKFKLTKGQQPSGGETVLQLEEATESPSFNFRTATKKLMHKYATKYDNAVKRTKWAIYERKVLEQLVSNLRSDVDDLIELFPERVARPVGELIVEEVEELDDTVLPVMQLVSRDVEDTAMEEAVAAEINKREESEGHTFEKFDIEGQTGLIFRAGDTVGVGATRSGAGSTYRDFKIRGTGKVDIGNEFHGQESPQNGNER